MMMQMKVMATTKDDDIVSFSVERNINIDVI